MCKQNWSSILRSFFRFSFLWAWRATLWHWSCFCGVAMMFYYYYCILFPTLTAQYNTHTNPCPCFLSFFSLLSYMQGWHNASYVLRIVKEEVGRGESGTDSVLPTPPCKVPKKTGSIQKTKEIGREHSYMPALYLLFLSTLWTQAQSSRRGCVREHQQPQTVPEG